MRAVQFVFLPPLLDEHLGFLERIEDLAVEEFIPNLAGLGLRMAILPRVSWLDEEGLDAEPADPFSHDFGGGFRPVVRPDVPRWAALHKEVRRALEHAVRNEPAVHQDRLAFPGVIARKNAMSKKTRKGTARKKTSRKG